MEAIKKTWFYFLVIIGIVFMISVSCSDNESTTTPPEEILKYLATGSYGDVIVFEINKSDNTIKYTNESTSPVTSGIYPYTLSTDPNLTGVYEIAYQGTIYYAMELSEKMFVTTFPSGNQQNSFCFGIYYGQNYDNFTMSQLSGKYLFTVFDNNNPNIIWGGYELLANGIINWNFGPSDPNDFDAMTHFSGNTSNWSKSTSHTERIISSSNNVNYEGIIYPGKLMLIDNGIGNGFTLGVNYPNTPVNISSIAGNYKYVDVTTHNEIGVGNYTIPGTVGGNVNFNYNYNGNTGAGSGMLVGFDRLPAINNAFKATYTYPTNGMVFTTHFIILPGEMFVQFVTDSNGIVSYGIGIKIN